MDLFSYIYLFLFIYLFTQFPFLSMKSELKEKSVSKSG